MKRAVLLIGALLGLPLLLFLRLGLDHDPNVIESPLIDKPAPAFRLADFEGRRLDFNELRGQPVVLNFWASWCQPCVYEHPLLIEAAREYGDRVHFVGVVPSEDRVEAIRRFEARLGGSWGPALWDSDGKVSIAYGVFKLPETYIIDKDGVIREKVAGPVDRIALRETLEGLL